ncbi:NAD(P)-binding protein, partial [Aspergillus indologenus CBS 114.80]
MPPPYTTQTTTADLLADYAPLIKGKVILTTGVSPNSLGGFFVQSLALARPSCLILAARNADQLAQTAAALQASISISTSTSTSTNHPTTQIRTLQIDLSSLESVRAAAAEVNGWDDLPAIDVVVNNAGIMGVPDYRRSPEGFEAHWATNHLGPFLFTNLLMPKIVAAPSPRVVVVSSDGHRLNPVRFDDFNFDVSHSASVTEGKSYDRWRAYGQSKTANMLFALSLAQKLGLKRNLQAFSLHPGVIFTNLDRDVDWSVGMKELR